MKCPRWCQRSLRLSAPGYLPVALGTYHCPEEPAVFVFALKASLSRWLGITSSILLWDRTRKVRQGLIRVFSHRVQFFN